MKATFLNGCIADDGLASTLNEMVLSEHKWVNLSERYSTTSFLRMRKSRLVWVVSYAG